MQWEIQQKKMQIENEHISSDIKKVGMVSVWSEPIINIKNRI